MLARPLSRALASAAAGAVLTVQPWPLAIPGAALLALGAALALRAVWRWDRTRVVLTNEKLFVVHGIVRRRTAGVGSAPSTPSSSSSRCPAACSATARSPSGRSR